VIKAKHFTRKTAKVKIEFVDQLSVYMRVSNGILRKEKVTMYIAIFGLECRPVSEFCGQSTESFYSFKSIRKTVYKLVD